MSGIVSAGARRRGSCPASRTFRGRLLVVLLCVAAGAASIAATGESRPAYVGRPLGEVLRELQEAGLPIVFSSATVPADATVVAEPTSRDPRRMLEELLEPHDLALRPTRSGRLVVVRRPPAVRVELRGVVRSSRDRLPIEGVRVRVAGERPSVESDRGGRFVLAVESGAPLTLQLDATGYRSLVRRVEVAEERLDLVLELEPLPVERERIDVSTASAASGAASPVSGIELDRVELERQPELAGDPLRAAGLVPGVTTQHSARPRVRGGEVGAVGIELDGVELYEPFHLLDYGGLLSIVPIGVVGELEIDTGGVDASRGDRLGGAFDMTTLVPDWRLRGAAEVGLLLAGAHASGTAPSGRMRWVASARVGLLEAAARALDVDEEPRYRDALLKGSFDLGRGRQELDLQALLSGDDLSVESFDPAASEDHVTRYRSRYAWLSHRSTLGSRVFVEQHLAGSELDGRRDGDAAFADGSFEVADERRLDVFGLRHDGWASLGARHELQWGGELREINVDLDYASLLRLEDPLAAVRTNPARLDVARNVSLDGRQEAGYVQDRWRTASFTVLAGLRWENGSLWGDRFLHPRVQIDHQPTARDRWSLAWGRYSQSQRPYELSIEDGEVELQPVERAEETVLGYQRTLPLGFRLAGELFDRSVSRPRSRWSNLFDPFSLFPETEADRVRIEPSNVRARGASIALSARLLESLEWEASFSATRVRETVGGERVRGSGDEPWDVRLQASWDPNERWSVRAAWRYHAGAPITPLLLEERPDAAPAVVLGALRSDRLGDLQSLDLEAVRSWRLGRFRLDVVLEIENAANTGNPRGYEHTLVGGPLDVGLEREPLFWPGRLPSFHVRLEL